MPTHRGSPPSGCRTTAGEWVVALEATNVAVKRCTFCGRVLHPTRVKFAGKTGEDIVPRWLMDHLSIRRLPINPIRVSAASRQIIDIRYHHLDSLLAPVCAACNNGWMSKLESTTKPILTRLIADPYRLGELTPEEKLVIARWTFKTAAALNRASTHGKPANVDARPVPDGHIRKIARGELPEDAIVVGGGYSSNKLFDWLQFSVWAAPKNGIPLSASDRERSYKIALCIGDLILAVAFYPSPEYRYGAIEGYHVPLWEGRRPLLLVNDFVDTSPTVSGCLSAERFIRNIFVVSSTWVELVTNVSTTRLISAS